MSRDPEDSSDLVDEILGGRDLLPPSSGPVRVVKGVVVPEGATRVCVTDEKGKTYWRLIADVKETDTIELSPKSEPQWMMKDIGRPRKNRSLHEQMPPSNETVRDLLRIKEANLRSDPIVIASENTPESPEVLNQVVIGLAEETASLRFERQEAERTGQDSSTASMRRVTALKAIAETWIKRKEQIQNQAVDIESPAFQAVLKFVAETFVEAMMKSGVRKEQTETVMSTFSKSLTDEWKSVAIARMKGE